MLDDFELNMSMPAAMVAEVLKQKEQAFDDSSRHDEFTCIVCMEQKLSREKVSIIHQDPNNSSRPMSNPGAPHVICKECLGDIVRRGRGGESAYRHFPCPMCRQPMHQSTIGARRPHFRLEPYDLAGLTVIAIVSIGSASLLALSGGPLPVIVGGICYTLVTPLAIACSRCNS